MLTNGGQEVLGFARFPLHDGFDAAIGQIPNPTGDRKSIGDPTCSIAKPNALNATRKQNVLSNHAFVRCVGSEGFHHISPTLANPVARRNILDPGPPEPAGRTRACRQSPIPVGWRGSGTLVRRRVVPIGGIDDRIGRATGIMYKKTKLAKIKHRKRRRRLKAKQKALKGKQVNG